MGPRNRLLLTVRHIIEATALHEHEHMPDDLRLIVNEAVELFASGGDVFLSQVSHLLLDGLLRTDSFRRCRRRAGSGRHLGPALPLRSHGERGGATTKTVWAIARTYRPPPAEAVAKNSAGTMW